jgi:hypothetical protein
MVDTLLRWQHCPFYSCLGPLPPKILAGRVATQRQFKGGQAPRLILTKGGLRLQRRRPRRAGGLDDDICPGAPHHRGLLARNRQALGLALWEGSWRCPFITKVEILPSRTCWYGPCRCRRLVRARHPRGGHMTAPPAPRGSSRRWPREAPSRGCLPLLVVFGGFAPRGGGLHEASAS